MLPYGEDIPDSYYLLWRWGLPLAPPWAYHQGKDPRSSCCSHDYPWVLSSRGIRGLLVPQWRLRTLLWGTELLTFPLRHLMSLLLRGFLFSPLVPACLQVRFLLFYHPRSGCLLFIHCGSESAFTAFEGFTLIISKFLSNKVTFSGSSGHIFWVSAIQSMMLTPLYSCLPTCYLPFKSL